MTLFYSYFYWGLHRPVWLPTCSWWNWIPLVLGFVPCYVWCYHTGPYLTIGLVRSSLFIFPLTKLQIIEKWKVAVSSNVCCYSIPPYLVRSVLDCLVHSNGAFLPLSNWGSAVKRSDFLIFVISDIVLNKNLNAF